MNSADADGDTNEVVSTAPQQAQSLSEEILSLMKGEEPEAPETQETPVEVPPQTVEELPEETEKQEEEEAAPAAAEGQWPTSASKRVAEESAKRRTQQSRADRAESERDHWMGVAQELQSRLEQSELPRPTPQDPLADVFDMGALKKAESHYLNIKEFATRSLDENPRDDEIEAVVGRNKDGEPRTETFTRKQLVSMRLNAEHALSKLIPDREQMLAKRAQADSLAMEVYPQFKENGGDNEWSGFVRETLAILPQLAKVPDIAIWLGHALTGRQMTLERLQKKYGGNAQVPPVGEHLVAASKARFKPAPPVSTGRVPSQSTPRRGADVEAARKSMKARPGDDEAMEAFIDAKLFRSPSRGYAKLS